MAKPLDKLPVRRRSPGRPASYPYERWLDGGSYLLLRGSAEEVDAGAADFSVEPRSLCTTIYRAAITRGVSVSCIQTTHADPDGAEREAVAVGPRRDG